MPRLALFNIGFGFLVIFTSACAGAFVALDTAVFLTQSEAAPTEWYLTLTRSAHGHFNLFGIIHVLFGLTLPYAHYSNKIRLAQSIALVLTTFAMGPGLWLRAHERPSVEPTILSIVIAVAISLGLIALFSHLLGVFAKINRARIF